MATRFTELKERKIAADYYQHRYSAGSDYYVMERNRELEEAPDRVDE